jgi:histidinol dehydrogenase
MNTYGTRFQWSELSEKQQRAILKRPAVDANSENLDQVRAIIQDVKQTGDEALRELTQRLDGVRLTEFRVDDQETMDAADTLTLEQKTAVKVAITNVSRFHVAQQSLPLRVETATGVTCEQIVRPIPAVGLYVPAGTAPLPSTAIMLAVPARLAGCPVKVLCTPPQANGRADPAVVYAAQECGITAIFKLGGAQAVAAMAYGSESVPKVDKIFGPGNAWVTAAKAEVAADPAGAALDMPAGPTELMVIADTTAAPDAVALDLLSQAEHGVDSQVVLVTDAPDLAVAVYDAAQAALPELPRRPIIEQALQNSLTILVDNVPQAIEVANAYAAEHLIMQVHNPRQYIDKIKNAGSVFLGPWTPEAVGDYCSGTNHVLPTHGYARAYSGLSTRDFQKHISVQEATKDGLRGLAPTVTALAGLEGLDAHAAAVRVRLDPDSGARRP